MAIHESQMIDFFHAHHMAEGRAEILDFVLNCVGEGIAVADKSGRLILMNPMAEKIVGIGATDTPPEGWSEKYGAFCADQVTPLPTDQHPLLRAIHGEDTDEFELFIRNERVPEGVFVRVTGRPLRDEHGDIQGGVVVFRDVTGQKRNLEAQQLLASIVQSSDDGIISWNLDKMITGWNRGAEKIYEYTVEEAIGLSAEDLLAPENHHEIDFIISTLKQGRIVNHYETQRLKKNGGLVEVSVSVSPLYDTSGRLIGASSITRDITEKKRSQRIRNEIKSRFASMITRELMVPASAIRENIENGSPQEALTHLEWLEHLIQNLRSYSQMESDRLMMIWQETDLSDLLSKTCRMMETAARRKNLLFSFQASSHPVAVQCDSVHLSAVVVNLIDNAIKFTDEGGRVDVRLKVDDSCAMIEVEDTGGGIEPEKLNHLFDAYRQRGTEQNMGIGLEICKYIVDQHHGQICAESRLGRGSRFTVTLPLEIEPEIS